MNDEMSNRLKSLQREAELSEKNLKKKTFDLQTVSDVSQDLGSLGDTQEILDNLLMMVMGNLGVLSGVILLVDTNRNKIETVVQRGMEKTSMDILSRVVESGYFKELQRSTDVQIPDEENDARQKDEKKISDLPRNIQKAQDLRPEINGKGKDEIEKSPVLQGRPACDLSGRDIRGLLSSFKINMWIPFEVNENLGGSIGLGDKLSGTSYTRDDRELLCTLSNQGALAIRNIKSMYLKEKESALSKYFRETKESQYDRIVWKSKKMQKLLQEAESLSKTDNPVTVLGEPGTGKELFARKIHADSARSKSPVIEFEISKERRVSKERRKREIEVIAERRRGNNIDRRQRDNVECELFGSEKMVLPNDTGKKIGTFELIDRGSLIIKNIENMPLSTQKRFLEFLETGNFSRVGGNGPIHSDVRVIVTTKDINLAQKQLDSRLFSLLSAHKLEVPPLRDRKRDIPSLMEHFIEKISKVTHIHAKSFSKEAINKLLKYNYPGNIRELENIIERAVELSVENPIIEEEVIFLGDVDVEDKIRLNLLNIPFIKKLCESQRIYSAAKTVVLICFIASLYFFLVQPDVLIGGKSIVLILCWQIAIPLLFVTYLFAARFACGICPLSTISKFINRYVGLKIPIPSFIKRQDFLVMGIGFMFILFIEEYTHMTQSITKTAYLILSVLFCTIIFDIIFEKSAWCRHLCPLGGLGRFFGMSSMIELRANKHTCTTICTTHDCYKGTEKVGPCPMFLHLQFLQDNRDCKLCLNCIKSCKHSSTRLNLRIPGAEIVSLKEPSLSGPLLSVAFSGFLIAEIISKMGIINASFPFMFSISIFFALSLNLLSDYITASITKSTVVEHLKHFGYTLLPLILCSYIALKLTEVFGNAKGYLMIFNIYKFNYNFTSIVQSILVITGLFISEYLIYKIIQNRIAKDKQFQTFIIQGTVPWIFSVIYISLFFKGA